MHLLDITLPTVEENLALDEALLDEAEATDFPEVLRLWESSEIAVVLGRSSRITIEANIEACERDEVPVLRRTSGGCAVLVGPGCLMYSLMLSYEQRPALHLLDQAHAFVLGSIRAALSHHISNPSLEGTSDLVWQGRKFSGNSLRCKRTHLLYHGTLLYDFPLEQIGRYLRMPPREPEYRSGRLHDEFVTNLPLTKEVLRQSLMEAFGAREPLPDWPQQRMQALMSQRYGREAWHAER